MKDMEQGTTATAESILATAGVALELEDFDALVRREQRLVYRFLLGMLRDPDAADNLTQECFLRAYRHRSRFRGECSVRTWLLRIAVNLARDHGKSRRLQFWRRLFAHSEEDGMLEQVTDPQASPERVLLAREELSAVRAAVAQLPGQQRAIFLLRFFEEMSIEEIAAAMSLRTGTVKTHLFRAIAAVREGARGEHS